MNSNPARHEHCPLKAMGVTLSFIAIVLGATAPSQADTHYVSKSGTNTYPYASWATATDSILLAIETAQEWDTVRVAAGSYTGDSLHLKEGMVFIGQGKDSTYVEYNGSTTFLVILANGCTVEGFHFDGIVDTNLHSGILTYHLLHAMYAGPDIAATVRANRLSNVYNGVETFFTDQDTTTKRVSIVANEFTHFHEAIFLFATSSDIRDNVLLVNDYSIGSPIDHRSGMSAVITGNVIVRSTRFAGNMIDLKDVANIVVRNNICVSQTDATAGGIWINVTNPGFPTTGYVENNLCIGGERGITSFGGNIRITNNIIMRTGLDLTYDLPATTPDNVGYNLFWQNAKRASVDTAARIATGCLFADPMFLDSNDYRLQAFSPAIDAGDTLLVDPDGTRSDIGPYGGPGGFTYAYQDLPPDVPKGLGYTIDVFANPPELNLFWFANDEADLGGCEIQVRKEVPNLMLDTTFNINISSPETTLTFTDTLLFWEIATFTFDVRSYDHQGNRSDWTGDPITIAAGSSSEDLELPYRFTLLPNSPNPFNGQTRLRYSLPEPAHVTLTIFDVLGRHVITLGNGVETPGEHELSWDGRNQDGQSVASGVYFYRLSAGGFELTRRMLQLK